MSILKEGSVGIGTTPVYAFEVVTGSSSAVFEYDTHASGTQTIKFEPSSTKAGGTSKIYSSYAGTGATEGKLALGTYSAQTAVVMTSTGNVGIGTDAPNSRVDVLTPSRSTAFAPNNGATWHDLIVRNPNNTQNAAVGLAFELHGTYHANAAAGIAAVKEVGSSDYGAGLALVTRPQSAVAEERVRITADGKVGIGTTAPDAELQVMNNDSSSYRFGYGGTSDVYFDADDVYFRSDNCGSKQITKKGGSIGIGVVNA